MIAVWKNVFKLTSVKLALLVTFVLVNVALYAHSKYLIMENVFHHFSSNRSTLTIHNFKNSSRMHSIIPYLRNHTSLENVNSPVDEYEFLTPQQRQFFQKKVITPHNFRYIVTPNVTCSNRYIELVICVVVSNTNHIGRSIIRETWGSYAYDKENNALIVFFIGSRRDIHNRHQRKILHAKIQEEASIFGDILQEDFIDSYENLSLKSVSILKWVKTFCPNTQFVLKVDDDMYVNIPFMITILREQVLDRTTPSAFIMGSMQEGAQPMRNPTSKWYTPYSLFQEDTYPNYVSGTAYVMTGQAASLLYEVSLRIPKFWLEDIYITGLCSREVDVKLYNSGYFTYRKPIAIGCNFRSHVSGHRYSHEEILNIHKELYDPNISCARFSKVIFP
uniref:Hexosyltransferase n=1 Tax=Arion vulgaris TaxID=1028688 RepID=A0A0B7BM48_9EUPU